MNVKPLAFNSLGTRSMATYVETDDAKILIDPGVSLAPFRYGLPPHALEWQRMDESWKLIKDYTREAEILIVTHYHYDHHNPSEPEIYRDKVTLIKHPADKINYSQQERAAYFLNMLGKCPKRLEYADGKKFEFGKTKIKFSPPVCHGTNPRLGYVVEVSISCSGEKVVHSSDVEGPSLDDQVRFLLDEKPEIAIVDGPMSYMLGFRYSFKSLQVSIQNLVQTISETSIQALMLDHHFMRDLRYESRIKPVYEKAKDRGVKVLTAAGFLGRRIEMLEACRKELYERCGEESLLKVAGKSLTEE